jgi:hypothetical protein
MSSNHHHHHHHHYHHQAEKKEDVPATVHKPMKCLSPLDVGSLGTIDQTANTRNHILFEQILVR